MKAAFGVIVLVLLVTCSLIYYHNFQLHKSLAELESRKEERFQEAVINERKLINQDLYEKYKTDIVSYQILAQRMEMERKRVKELEEKLK